MFGIKTADLCLLTIILFALGGVSAWSIEQSAEVRTEQSNASDNPIRCYLVSGKETEQHSDFEECKLRNENRAEADIAPIHRSQYPAARGAALRFTALWGEKTTRDGNEPRSAITKTISIYLRIDSQLL